MGRDGHSRTERAREWFDVVRGVYEGSWVAAFVAQLKALHVADWTTVFGAELLWSALPFMILLSSLANERIDGDLSRHIGLDQHGARIVRSLFRHAPAHAVVPVLTGLLIALAGVIAVVGSLHLLYERVFDLEHHGWREFPRYFAWVGILVGVLIVESSLSGPEQRLGGTIAQAVVTFALVALFFAWTMHFLLAGRVPWSRVLRPALVTAAAWTALAFFSSAYFSSVLVDDSKTFGTIGVVFTLLTWFILIGGVIILGAAGGAVWEQRARDNAIKAGPRGSADQPDEHDER